MFRNNRASFGNRRTENYQYWNYGEKRFVTCFDCSGSTEHMEITVQGPENTRKNKNKKVMK